MIFHLKISSKTKLHMFKFISFFFNLKFLPFTITRVNSYNRKKFITVLKSPHVNKTAQEQFEFRYYNCQFLIYSSKPLLLLIVLKRLFGVMFLELKLELKVLIGTLDSKEKLINPDCFILEDLNKKKFKFKNIEKSIFLSSKGLLKYIQLFDLHGEINLKNLLNH